MRISHPLRFESFGVSKTLRDSPVDTTGVMGRESGKFKSGLALDFVAAVEFNDQIVLMNNYGSDEPSTFASLHLS